LQLYKCVSTSKVQKSNKPNLSAPRGQFCWQYSSHNSENFPPSSSENRSISMQLILSMTHKVKNEENSDAISTKFYPSPLMSYHNKFHHEQHLNHVNSSDSVERKSHTIDIDGRCDKQAVACNCVTISSRACET
jgi:hypothetical protein